MDKWISVGQYATKYGLKRTNLYMKIYMGKMPKDKWRKRKMEIEKFEMLDIPPVDKSRKDE